MASPLDSKKDVVSNTIAQIGNILESIGLFTPGRDQLQVQQGYSDAGSYDKDATRERHSKDPEIIPAIDLDPTFQTETMQNIT